MGMPIKGNLTFLQGGAAENLRLQNLASDPVTPYEGQMWLNTTTFNIKALINGTVVTIATGGSTAVILQELDAVETAIGLAEDGSLPSLTGSYISGSATLIAALQAIDTQLLSATNAAGAAQTTANTAVTAAGAAQTAADNAQAAADAAQQTADGAVTNASNAQAAADAAQTEIDAVETSVGLSGSGSLPAFTGAYTTGSTSVIDAIENVEQQVSVNTTDIATKVSKSGDSMTGNLAFGGTSTATGLAAPVNGTDAARLIDVQNAIAGLDFQTDVVGTEAEFVGVAGRYIYIDGSEFTGTASVGDIVSVNATGAISEVSYDVSVKGVGALVWNTTAGYWMTYNGTVWGEFGGLAGVTAGVGLSKTGNVIEVNLGAGIAQLPSDEVGIDVRANSGLFLTVDGVQSSDDTAAQLAVQVDSAEGLTITASGIAIAGAGVDETKLAASVAGTGLTGGNGAALSVVAATGITVTGSGVGLDLTYADARYANKTTTDSAISDLQSDVSTVTTDLSTLTTTVSGISTDLSALTTTVSNGYFEYDGTGAAATTHVVVHNLNRLIPAVTVLDDTGHVVIPDDITYNSANQITVTFLAATTCRVGVIAPVAPVVSAD